MTDNTNEAQKLDLAQRIAAALTRTDEPVPNPSALERRESDIELGVVPFHLQHLHNLLVDAERGEHSIIHKLFFRSLDSHIISTDVDLHKIKLLPDWTVLGVPDDGRSRSGGMPDGMIMIELGRFPPERESRGFLDFLLGRGARGRRH